MSDTNAEIERLHRRYDEDGKFPPFCAMKIWYAKPSGANADNKRHDVIEWAEDSTGDLPCNTPECPLRIEGDPSFPGRAKITGSCCLTVTVELQPAKAA